MNMSSNPHRCHLFLAASLLAGLVACPAEYQTITIYATVDDAVELPVDAAINIGAANRDDISKMVILEQATVTDPDTRRYRAYGAACIDQRSCKVWTFAYIDLDGDEMWTTGEPWGADPANPKALHDSGYVAEIEIGPDVEASP